MLGEVDSVFVEERWISMADGGRVWIAMDMGAGRCRLDMRRASKSQRS